DFGERLHGMSTQTAPIAAHDVSPELNPALDFAALAADFRANGRAHIPNVLTHESALKLHGVLAQETPWRLTLNKGGDFLDFANVTLEERHRIARGAWERAQTQFQYLF